MSITNNNPTRLNPDLNRYLAKEFASQDLSSFTQTDWSLTAVAISAFFSRCTAPPAQAVVVDRKYGFLPVLIGNDGAVVPLYRLIGGIEEVLDESELIEQFPNLSRFHIASSLSFLRRLAQFNAKDIDIDSLEDEAFESDTAIQAMLVESLRKEPLPCAH
jgi:hypothetical protein